MLEKTVAELSKALRSREVSSVELTQAYLEKIATVNERLNTYITTCDELALKQASKADQLRADGNQNPLLGIPIAHKDIFCTKNIKTTCGSKMLENFVSPYDATIVSKLNKAGAVTLGKTNMDEFAMGSSNETSYFGSVKNPWDTNKVPGGSSGGSAAAVAADLCAIATGTDTGGSIRQPASFCGVTGLKPSYGRVSRWGMIAFASSLDQAGPISKSAEDAAILMNVIAGADNLDSTSSGTPVVDYTLNLNDPLHGLKIGVPKQHFAEGLSADVEESIRLSLKQFEKLGASITQVDLPNNHLSVPAYYVVAPAEASANLSRYDGVRYGFRCDNPIDLEDMYMRTRSEGFGSEVKRRIMVGTYALSAGYYDAYYQKAQKIRRLIKNDFDAAFETVDVIVGPTSPHTAFSLGATTDPVKMYLEDIYTIAVNLAGLPGISIPAGFGGNLPIGMQIVGKEFAEAKLLNVAHQYQQVTEWHKSKPSENFGE